MFVVYLSWSNWNLELLGFEKRGKPEYPGKTSDAPKEKTNNKLNPHMALMLGFEPGQHWWGVSSLTTVPSLGLLFPPVIAHFEFNSRVSLGRCCV